MRKTLGLIGFALILGACATGPADLTAETPESRAFFALGVSSYADGDYATSLDYFIKAENFAPTNPTYEMHTGIALMALERQGEAEKKIVSACAKKLDYPECWNNLSAFYLRSGRTTEALALAQKAATSPINNLPEVALANEARALVELRRYPEALSALQKAERIGQQSCDIYLLKSKVYNRQKLYDLALDSAKRAASTCTADPRTHFWVAYSLEKNRRHDLSQKKLLNMLDTFRDEKTVFRTKQYLEQIEKRIPLKEPST